MFGIVCCMIGNNWVVCYICVYFFLDCDEMNDVMDWFCMVGVGIECIVVCCWLCVFCVEWFWCVYV